ncbi:hypothetical protein Taro_004568 [Colocasia esculenta]|uniref:non-specific serine/threonine protein kinase n=1 Tax=Colocasia esculenta TaxID=4460 RepID=A0A843TS19_COLES|nr:hypothetical protein [Colocasia esculenta]
MRRLLIYDYMPKDSLATVLFGNRRLLVYAYMPKGSLATALFGDSLSAMDWLTRYQIILGTTRGLTYFHEKCKDYITHYYIKRENIFLDTSFVPKVADFGLAKFIDRDFSRVLTTMRGTRGTPTTRGLVGEHHILL